MLQKNQETGQPMVVKYVETQSGGVRSITLSRYAIGYIVHGTKYIHSGDKRKCLTRGDLFYLGIGLHYTEELPEADHPFEQIVFYYTPDELQRILLHLNVTYRLSITNNHICTECRSRSEVSMPSWPAIRSIFLGAASYLRDEGSLNDPAAGNFKMTELIYHIVSHEDSCLKSKVLSSIDSAKENFEQIVYGHIFRECSIEELAQKTNRSRRSRRSSAGSTRCRRTSGSSVSGSSIRVCCCSPLRNRSRRSASFARSRTPPTSSSSSRKPTASRLPAIATAISAWWRRTSARRCGIRPEFCKKLKYRIDLVGYVINYDKNDAFCRNLSSFCLDCY